VKPIGFDRHGNYLTEFHQREIDRIGSRYGCHTCGTKDPGTATGRFVVDVQPPTAIVKPGQSQRLYPHCLSCSRTQGRHVLVLLGRFR
jgi:hypothetical protein